MCPVEGTLKKQGMEETLRLLEPGIQRGLGNRLCLCCCPTSILWSWKCCAGHCRDLTQELGKHQTLHQLH